MLSRSERLFTRASTPASPPRRRVDTRRSPPTRRNSLALRAQRRASSFQKLAYHQRPRALFAPLQALAVSLPHSASQFSDGFFFPEHEQLRRRGVYGGTDFAFADRQGHIAGGIRAPHLGRYPARAEL